MKKRLIAVTAAILIISLCAALTGCKKNETENATYDEVIFITEDAVSNTEPTTSNSKGNNWEYLPSEGPESSGEQKATANSASGNINPNASSIAKENSSPVVLSESMLDLKTGETKTLTVSINVDKTGTSSYSAVCNNDNVKIKCSGEKISITAKQGGNTVLVVNSGGKKASCNIIILGNASSNQAATQSKTITDDTKVKYSELCTDYYQSKITAGVNIAFYKDGKGAAYISSLKKDDSEAKVIEVTYSSLKNQTVSINSLVNDLYKQFEDEMKKSDSDEEFDITKHKINCYSEKTGSGEYNIYFCYK